MKYLLAIICAVLLTSCASLSENFIKDGTLSLNGGRHKEVTWDEPLVFSRRSWYHELTLMADVLYAPVNEDSPYFRWFHDSIKDDVKNCPEFKIFLTYALDPDRLSEVEILKQIEEQGGEMVTVSRFADFVKLHPDVEELSLQLYEVNGMCLQEKGKTFIIDIPSYPSVKLE